MFTASQIKCSTHVSSSPKSKTVPSLLHAHTHMYTHTHTHHNNLYGCLDLLTIQELLGPPPCHALLQSPTSGVGQSPEIPRERFLSLFFSFFLVAPKKKSPILSLPGVHEGIMTTHPSTKMLRSFHVVSLWVSVHVAEAEKQTFHPELMSLCAF